MITVEGAQAGCLCAGCREQLCVPLPAGPAGIVTDCAVCRKVAHCTYAPYLRLAGKYPADTCRRRQSWTS